MEQLVMNKQKVLEAIYKKTQLYTIDRSGIIIHVNKQLCKQYGFAPGELIGQPYSIMIQHIYYKDSSKEIWQTINSGEIWYGTMQKRAKDGTLFFEHVTIIPFLNSEGIPYKYVSIGTIINEVKATSTSPHDHNRWEMVNAAEILSNSNIKQAFSNRDSFYKQLISLIEWSKGKGETFALLFITLDQLHWNSDMLKDKEKDEIFTSIAKRVAKTININGVFARLNDKECALLLPNCSRKETKRVAMNIIEQFMSSFTIGYREIYITPIIGISMFPDDGEELETIIHHVGLALHYAKEHSDESVVFFSSDLQKRLNIKNKLAHDLQYALEERQFSLYYQPQWNIENNNVFGVEALIRWNHPQKGLVSPGKFIPIAEETGLIVPIGEWVLQTACKQNKKWQDEGYEPIVVSVNVSPQQFVKKNFVQVVKQTLQETKLDPQYLELEITEVMTMDVAHAKKTLTELKIIGVRVSIDDFGTDYSSLHYLSKLPINKLKIDQSFLRKWNKQNKAIVKTIISLAKNLNIGVIAEGVEEEKHVHFLKSQSCNQVQGFYFSKPLPATEVTRFFRKY